MEMRKGDFPSNQQSNNVNQNYQSASTPTRKNARPRVLNSSPPSDVPFNTIGQNFHSQLPTSFNSVSQHETPIIHQMPMHQVSYKRYKSEKANQEAMPNGNNLYQSISDVRSQQIAERLQMQQMSYQAAQPNGNNLYQTISGVRPQQIAERLQMQQMFSQAAQPNGNNLYQTISDVRPQQIAERLQMQQMSSQAAQTGLAPQALLDPTHQVRLGNFGAWIDAAYAEVVKMKDMYMHVLMKRYRKVIAERERLPNDLEVVARHDKIRDHLNKIMRFLGMSKTDMMSCGEVNVSRSIIKLKSWIHNFLQLDQNVPLPSQSRSEQSVIQSYGPTMSSQGSNDFSTNMYNSSDRVSQGSMYNSSTVPNHQNLNPLNSHSSSGFLDSTHQTQLENSSAWVDKAFEQFSLMKHAYLDDVMKAYKNLTEYKKLATDLETAATYDKTILAAKKTLQFFHLTKTQFMRDGEVKAYFAMEQLKSLIDQFRRMQLPLKPGPSQPRTEKIVDPSQSCTDNIVSCATSHPSVQVSQGKSMIQNSARMGMDQETMSTQNLKRPMQYTNEILPSNKKHSFVAPQNSKVLIERNDLKSKKQVDFKERLLPSEGRNNIPNVPLEENRERDQNQDLQGTSGISRLIQVVKSISFENLNASLRDIEAVTNATDRLGVFIDWDSNVTVEDLTNYIRSYDDGDVGLINCRPNTIVSSTETTISESGEMNRQKKEPDDKLLEEIKEINRKLIEVVVDVTNVKQGTLIRCSYSPIGPVRKTGKAYTSQSLFPRLILQLVVSADYPRSSPTIVETPPPGCSEVDEEKEMWMKAKSNFSLLIRRVSEPISLWNMVKTWDICARDVYREFAKRHGGGSFTSNYGKWEVV